MNKNSTKTHEFDVELVLGSKPSQTISALKEKLPKNYFIVDRSPKVWGYVIEIETKRKTDIDSAVIEFLAGLELLKKEIKPFQGTLRIGIFQSTVTCTVKIKRELIALLETFDLDFVITTYPSSEEDHD